MATVADVATAIASALAEVGVTGKLSVKMNGDHAVAIVGDTGADDVQVDVVVTPI